MAVIGMRNMCWGFGDPPLLEKITFQVTKGESVCLLGCNGLGKSTPLFITHDCTFLKKIANQIMELDRGCLS